MSTIESRKVNWLTLSLRARLDIATLVAAGAASTLLFLLPVLPFLERSSAADLDAPQIIALAPGPEVDYTNATLSAIAMTDARPFGPTPRRAATRATRAPRLLTTTVSKTAREEKRPQSKLARLFLGDGSERVQPFPMPDTRARR